MVGRKKQEAAVEEKPTEPIVPEAPVETHTGEPESEEVPEVQEHVRKYLPEDELRIVISNMISRPKPRGSIPTFVTFREKDQIPKHHVILDIPEPFLKEAWEFYCNNTKRPSAEEFLIMVYDIMKMGIPRLYRKVAKLDLL